MNNDSLLKLKSSIAQLEELYRDQIFLKGRDLIMANLPKGLSRNLVEYFIKYATMELDADEEDNVLDVYCVDGNMAIELDSRPRLAVPQIRVYRDGVPITINNWETLVTEKMSSGVI